MHPFDDATQLTPTGPDRFAARTTPAYANMVGPFGGITHAVMLEAVMSHADRVGEPIALTVNFAAPIAYGSFDIEARALRTNRSTQHWWIAMRQGGDVVTTATAVTATRRETWSAAEASMPGGLPAPADLRPGPTEGLPQWVQCYDMRFVDGGLAPFDGKEKPDSVTRLWLRDEPPRPLTFTSLAAICDCFFPRIMVRRGRMVPAGTVSLTTCFHADGAMLQAQADRYVLGVARALNFRNNYFDQAAEIWGDTGQLLASSHQVCYFRD